MSYWLMVFLGSTMSFLIFCLLNLSIFDQRTEEVSNHKVGSFISPWSSLSFCLVKFDTLLLGTYITQWELLCLLGELTPLSLCNAPIYSWYFPVLKCTMSKNQYSYLHFCCLIVIPTFIHLPLICVLIFIYRQHIVMSYFLIHSDNLF